MNDSWQEYRLDKPLFGAEVTIIAYFSVAPEFDVMAALEQVYLEGLRLQKIFNVFDPNSELSLLNTQRHRIVSPELLEVLTQALSICEMTAGRYDVTQGVKIQQLKQTATIDATAPARTCSYEDIQIRKDLVTLVNASAQIDLNSIAKGYIADAMIRFGQTLGLYELLIDARGDIHVAGKITHQLPIQHPRGTTTESIGTVAITNCAVATSGDYRQKHIVHQSDVMAVTIIGSNLAEADAWATALMVCNTKMREALIATLPHLAILVVDVDESLHMYNQFRKNLVN